MEETLDQSNLAEEVVETHYVPCLREEKIWIGLLAYKVTLSGRFQIVTASITGPVGSRRYTVGFQAHWSSKLSCEILT